MKKLLTTSAILLATTFAANANSNIDENLEIVELTIQVVNAELAAFEADNLELDAENQAKINTMQNQILSLYTAVLQIQEEVAVGLEDAQNDLATAEAILAVTAADLEVKEAILAVTQDELAVSTVDLTDAYADLDDLQDTYAAVNSKYISLADSVDAAENKAYMGKGDIFKLVVGTEDYEAKNASYDPGSSAVTFSTDLTNGSMSLSNVTLSGKYHNFSINTDITADNLADRVKLKALVHVINDKAYNEGYKDGFNDGYEIGFNNGYGKAVSDIRAAESPL